MLNETLQGICGTHGVITHAYSQAHVYFANTIKHAPRFIKRAPKFIKHAPRFVKHANLTFRGLIK